MPSSTSSRVEATFCFVDLAGYTALTEAQGDEDAADVATRFADITREALEPGDRLVKTIGDAVLVTTPNAVSGVSLVERLLTYAAGEPGFPSLRAGLHHGDAVERDGDVFGACVNLASRVAGEAHAGEVLGTEPIALAARELGIPVAELGAVLLKNVRDAIPLFSLALVVGATETPIDPVCRTPVDRRAAAGRLRYRGEEFWFCSLTCAAAFASNPGWHAAEARRTRPPRPG
ncbi:MAG: YHS domain-containing protein [Myxococcales bacterium]|nr:YHS domain-containing protein [Myxococcales bacterium]MCB9579290.1 YHS domain-containing protein [Polyangiaceae bacterium]